jgi:uncharacterized protein YaaQ
MKHALIEEEENTSMVGQNDDDTESLISKVGQKSYNKRKKIQSSNRLGENVFSKTLNQNNPVNRKTSL